MIKVLGSGERPRRPSRVVGSAYVAAALALATILAYIALTSRSDSPPQIAEFAPQAQKVINNAPSEQTSTLGSAPGGAPAAVPSPSPATVPSDAMLHHCVGDPPRQIEDPQSPPCVPFWKGKNGGATFNGVTPEEITVAVGQPQSWDTYDAGVTQATPALLNFFNKRFETYGRTIKVVPFTASGGAVTNQHTDATTVADKNPFAVIPNDSYVNNADGANLYFNDDLARRHVITMLNEQNTTLTTSHLAAMAPYEWSYFQTLDQDEANMAEMICKELNGKQPRWAGPSVATAPKRVFGVIHEVAPDGTNYEDATLLNGLATCGVTPFVTTYHGGYDAATYDSAISQMQTNHVTTITCLCQGNDLPGWETTAESQSYVPEWLINGNLQDNDDQGELGEEQASAEASHRIGISTLNKMLPLTSMPWWWAVSEGNPASNAAEYQGNDWYYGANYMYLGLLALVSGIQLAGPNLTPATFERGLQRAVFANPGSGGPPLYQARVGFAGGSHTMVQDVTPIWWSANAQSTYWAGYSGGKGTWCYLDRGVRFGVGEWPRKEPDMFNGPCQ